MTATIAELTAVETSQIGYVEGGGPDGHSGNITKYWAELDPTLQGQPWCACFQRWCHKHAGAPLLPIANPYYCPSIVTYAKQHGLWLARDKGSPGDLVLFQFAGNGVADHVGFIESVHLGYYTTVEGNTSPGTAGSQRNGGGVYRRQRPIGDTILGILDFSRYLAASAGGTPPRNPVKHNPYTEPTATLKQGCEPDSASHLTWVHWVQWAVGVPCDGAFGPQTSYAVRQFQHYHGLAVDGVVGPNTRAKLALVTH